MNRLATYAKSTAQWTRIEMLLAAFDGTIARLEKAKQLLEQNQPVEAAQPLLTAQRLVLALYEGIDVRYGDIPKNMQQLYLYVLGCIGVGKQLDLPAAIKVLKIIQGGLVDIKESANEMERTGQLSPAPENTQILRNIVA